LFSGIRKAINEIREIRQILRDRRLGVTQARIEQEVAEQAAQRRADSIAYRKKIERALRRKPNMTVTELRKRFPVDSEVAKRG
jgi:hypothetical protein